MDNLYPLLSTPGGKNFFKKISKELISGSNVIIRLPKNERQERIVIEALNPLLWPAGLRIDTLDSRIYQKSANLLSFMNKQPMFSKSKTRKNSFADFFKNSVTESLTHKILCLFDPDSFEAADPDEMAKDLVEAATATRENGTGNGDKKITGHRFLAVVSPLFPPTREVEGLAVFNWFDATSSIDHDMMFAQAENELDEPLSDIMYWWLKAICMGAGGNDPDLISTIIKRAPKFEREIADILLAHPLSKKISNKFVFESKLLYRGVSHIPEDPPEDADYKILWENGILTPNRFCMYHPATLATDKTMLSKFIAGAQTQVLSHLLAQVIRTVLFVIEDKIDIAALEYYTEHEMKKAGRNDTDVNSQIGKSQAEIGPLLHSLRNYIKPPESDKSFIVKELTDLAYAWKVVRDKTAHFEVCSHEIFEYAMNLYKYVRDKYLENKPPWTVLRPKALDFKRASSFYDDPPRRDPVLALVK